MRDRNFHVNIEKFHRFERMTVLQMVLKKSGAKSEVVAIVVTTPPAHRTVDDANMLTEQICS